MAHLIAITASKAGPAHAFMTGEALRAAAEKLPRWATSRKV